MTDSASSILKTTALSLKIFFNKLNQWRRGNELIFYGTFWLAIALLVWYLLQPGAETIRVYLSAPGVTNLQAEKPRPDPLQLEFGDSVAKLNQIGKTISEGLSLSPAIEGQWKWTSDRQLVFIPAQEWQIATTYRIKLDKELFPSNIQLDDYSPSFETEGFTAVLDNTDFFQDPQNPKLKKLVSTVRFSHRLDKDDFKGRVTLIMKDADPRVKDKGKAYPFELSFNKVGNEAYIHSQPIDIPLKEQTLVLSIDDGARSQDGGVSISADLSTEVSVPGMYSYFRIGSATVNLVRNEQNDPEQVLILETTDGVEESVLKNNIELLLLPLDRPATKGRKVEKNYEWYNVEEIGPEILTLSTAVSVKALPAEHEYAKLHSFRIDVPPNRTLYIRVNKGIESVGGYKLAKTHDATSRIPEYPRELEIMGKGGVLSLSGDKRISVVSRGNKAVQFEIARVLPAQVQHLISQTGGDFQDPYFTNYNFDEDNISQRYTQELRLKSVAPGKSQYTSFDLSQYLNRPGSPLRNGIFLLKIHGWDYKNNQRTGVTDKRLVLITDLGMIVKENADKTRDLFVMSIKQGAPVAAAKVQVIGKNGSATYTTQTDANGRARIPDHSDYGREKMPTAYLVNHNGDLSFLPYNRYDRKLDLSRFDIGGVRQYGEKDALSAYLFSDRGIYRPGDSFNIGMIIKSSNWKRDLTGIPLQSVITDPRGLVIKSEKFALTPSGFESLNYQTRDSSPTGEYEIRLYLIKDEHERNLLGSVSLKLEEFLPDRMKISSRFSQERALGWVHPKDLAARVNLKNLYGTPATQRRISGSMTLSPYHPVFQKFSAFRFYDPLKAEKGFSERLPEAETDDNGEAELILNLQRFASASYNVSLQVNGFEAEGGRSVSTQRSILVSPRDFLVGYKADGKLDYVGKDSKRKVHFIAIDPALILSRTKGLKLELIEQRYVSALVKQDNGTYKYQSVLKEKRLSEKPLSIPLEGLDYSLPTDMPGDYVLVVRDSKGTELNKVNFSVAGEANLARSLEKNAELQIKLNKRDYEPGESIQVNIRAPYRGAGLITIERDKVYSYKWFKTNSTNSVQSITLPQGMEGNAYVNVSFVRDLASREIFMSPLSYGVAPFTISRDARRNKVSLDVPYLMRPGEKVKIAYKAQHAGKIVVFAVDEGILQVANYKTPKPLKHFFRKKALEVETAQLMDLILPEYSVVRQFSAAGGGMYESESKNLNPFKRRTQKAVAYWSGIIDADGKGGELDYQVPDYFNGSLRFMAVAVSQASLGVTQKKALSRGHFVLSPNVPTFVAPGDEFDVSVNVANNVEGSGQGAKVSLKLQVSSHLELLGEASQQSSIDEGREKSLRFRLRAKQQLGSATFRFTAASGDKQAIASVDLSVRPPLTRMVDVSGDSVQKDDVELNLKRDMYSEFRQRQVMLSPVPLGLANGMLRYLDEYPHLCTEQLVSKVFPIV
ncbi:MAG: alpha-2-macroglobulin, partial [Gammaproteobacteria bacterium]|nr:alpha-2-macroglobulin [Gammaproteobacteria bacterium]